MYKTLLIIAIIFISGIWVYNWYMGHNAPSKAEVKNTNENEAVAYVAGGCFWCVESDFEKLPEIIDAVSGYMGGSEENPTYNDVASGKTTHRETVKITYDPNKTSYREIILHLLRHIDPTDDTGSFYDRGNQYTSAVYYNTEREKKIAEEVIKELNERKIFDRPIVTAIEPAGAFWTAEDYHQDYHDKNSIRYKYYRDGSGRDKFIDSVWGDGEHDDLFQNDNIEINYDWKNFEKPSDEELKKTLSDIQYKITQHEGTEVPFQNEYWDNHEEGIYVDIVSGEPLFSSTDKFDSGTGWPSFLKPIDYEFVTEKQDYKLILPRTEIRSKIADSHLGHIILDGPESNDKIRYCMNSASLRFVPKEKMGAEGYGDFLYLFKQG